MNSLIVEHVKESSKRPVIARCLGYMDALDDLDKIRELASKPFTELHELAKRLKQESKSEVQSFMSTALKTSHSNLSREE